MTDSGICLALIASNCLSENTAIGLSVNHTTSDLWLWGLNLRSKYVKALCFC